MIDKKIICKGLDYLGTPYQFNAPVNQTRTFDCSSFVQHLYGVHGIRLPRNSRQQYLKGKQVASKNIKKGDLLFFTTKQRKHNSGPAKIGHVSIYIGNYLMLHTRRNGDGVSIEKIDDSWRSRFVGAKRVIQ